MHNPLADAAWAGDVDTVNALLNQGADINIKAHDDWTPLHAAAENQEPETLRLLVERGANLNVQTEYGQSTPLMIALDQLLWQSDADKEIAAEIVRVLLDAGADAETLKDRTGHTTLSWLNLTERTEIYKLLMQEGRSDWYRIYQNASPTNKA